MIYIIIQIERAKIEKKPKPTSPPPPGMITIPAGHIWPRGKKQKQTILKNFPIAFPIAFNDILLLMMVFYAEQKIAPKIRAI